MKQPDRRDESDQVFPPKSKIQERWNSLTEETKTDQVVPPK